MGRRIDVEPQPGGVASTLNRPANQWSPCRDKDNCSTAVTFSVSCADRVQAGQEMHGLWLLSVNLECFLIFGIAFESDDGERTW